MRLLEPSRNYRPRYCWQEEDGMTGREDEESKDAHVVYCDMLTWSTVVVDGVQRQKLLAWHM